MISLFIPERMRATYLSQLEKVLTSCAESEHAVKLSRTAAMDAEAAAVDEESGQPNMEKFEEVNSWIFVLGFNTVQHFEAEVEMES